MKLLRLKIQNECDLKRTRMDVIEKDYALSYILAGIATQSQLNQSLVFKGGTALKKIFFGDYRFSVDLDFSTIDAPKDKMLEEALKSAVNSSRNLLSNYGPFELQLKRYPEREPHPHGQEAFNIYVKFPWHRTSLCTVKIEVTHDEPIILAPQYKPIIHGYEESLDCVLACYQLEEIIAEKLRALLQTHQKLVTLGWHRPRARDYYDLWRIFKDYQTSIISKTLIEILGKKCKHRNVTYQSVDDFFTHELVTEANQHWQSTLGILVNQLPECQIILDEVKNFMERMIQTQVEV